MSASRKDRNVHLHITMPPDIAALVRKRSAETYRSLGQVIVDALLHTYGGRDADAISANSKRV